jgi:hypothetical protein
MQAADFTAHEEQGWFEDGLVDSFEMQAPAITAELLLLPVRTAPAPPAPFSSLLTAPRSPDKAFPSLPFSSSNHNASLGLDRGSNHNATAGLGRGSNHNASAGCVDRGGIDGTSGGRGTSGDRGTNGGSGTSVDTSNEGDISGMEARADGVLPDRVADCCPSDAAQTLDTGSSERVGDSRSVRGAIAPSYSENIFGEAGDNIWFR